jgi:hypothetical protein
MTSPQSSPANFSHLKAKLSTLSREELIEALEAQRVLEARMKEAPLLFYHRMLKKHHKQQSFFSHIKNGKRRVAFFGGNRSGKTTAGGHQAVANGIGYRYWEIPDLTLTQDGLLPPRENIPTKHWVRRPDGVPIRVPNTGLIITGSSRLRGIGQTIYPYIWSILPKKCKALSRPHKGAQGVPETIELWNGSVFMFATEEQDTMTLESFIADWAWCDEPISQDKYSAIWARLTDFLGPFYFTLTPLKGKCAWLHRLFIKEAPEDTAKVMVSQYDNPGLTAEMIKAFERDGNFTKAEAKARIWGEFEFLGNRVLEAFDPTVHVIPAQIPPEDWIHGVTVDPHHKRPAYIIFWAYNPHAHRFIFYKEWPNVNFFELRSGGRTPQEYATILRTIEGNVRRRIAVWRCDPRFGKAEHLRHGIKEPAWVVLMREQGIEFDATIPNTAEVEYGHQVITQLLHYDKTAPLGGTNVPGIQITEECQNAIDAAMNYAYREDGDLEMGVHRKVSEEYKDPIDAIRYTVLKPIFDFGRWNVISPYSEGDIAQALADDLY